MKNAKLYLLLRIILGFALLAFGVSGLLQLAPLPEMNEMATTVITAYLDSGYVLTVVQLVFVVTGLAFILNKWVALSAIVLFPISLNIVLFHLFLEPAGSIVGIVVLAINIYLLVANKEKFKPLLAVK